MVAVGLTNIVHEVSDIVAAKCVAAALASVGGGQARMPKTVRGPADELTRTAIRVMVAAANTALRIYDTWLVEDSVGNDHMVYVPLTDEAYTANVVSFFETYAVALVMSHADLRPGLPHRVVFDMVRAAIVKLARSPSFDVLPVLDVVATVRLDSAHTPSFYLRIVEPDDRVLYGRARMDALDDELK